jgi:hypothetical protein
MTSLTDRIKALAEFRETEIDRALLYDNELLAVGYKSGAKQENDRLTPLLTALAECAGALESINTLVDDDNMVSETEDGEKEYWINNDAAQGLCEEALTALEKVVKEMEGSK